MNAMAVERVELRTARSHFVNFGKATQNINMKPLKIHWKYVYKLEGRDFVNASPLEQIEFRINMSETIVGSKTFETDAASKHTFVKIHWGYVACLAAPNRHVRQTIRIVDSAQRCKI